MRCKDVGARLFGIVRGILRKRDTLWEKRDRGLRGNQASENCRIFDSPLFLELPSKFCPPSKSRKLEKDGRIGRFFFPYVAISSVIEGG